MTGQKRKTYVRTSACDKWEEIFARIRESDILDSSLLDISYRHSKKIFDINTRGNSQLVQLGQIQLLHPVPSQLLDGPSKYQVFLSWVHHAQ